MSGIALVLAGHGSHISANTAGVVWSYVDRLRGKGVADEITACFWKEPPAFSQILETLESPQAVVVPVFTAKGYFTRQVIPGEMGLRGKVSEIRGKRVHLTEPIGEHPQLDRLVDRLLRDMLTRHQLNPDQTAAALIGHGTPRSPQSRDATRRQAERVRKRGLFREVVDAYLDDQPDIPSIYTRTGAQHIIALPYFLADGSHVTRDLPRALGIAGRNAPEEIDGRLVYYSRPIGDDESICEVILALARTSGLPFEVRPFAGAWDGFPAAGRRELLDALEYSEGLHFGQVCVKSESVSSVDSSDANTLTSPPVLRGYVRDAPFRPLPTRDDLPGGWHVPLDKPRDAHAALETVYPGLVADWAAQRNGALITESLADIGARQDGMFKDIHLLPASIIERTIKEVCGSCIRQPTWYGINGELPCRAACNWWLGAARKNERKSA